MKDYSRYYWERRLDEAKVVELLKLAWEELYEPEFDQDFGAWQGGHFEPETEMGPLTGKTRYAGPPLLVSIHRGTRALRMDYPREEFIGLEQAEIKPRRQLPPGKR